MALRQLGTCREDWAGWQGCELFRTCGFTTENSSGLACGSRSGKAWCVSAVSKPGTSLRSGKESNEQQSKTWMAARHFCLDRNRLRGVL